MKNRCAAIFGALILVLSSAVHGAKKFPVRGGDQFIGLQGLLRALSLNQKSALFRFTLDKPCDSTIDCPLDVKVIPLFDAAGKQVWCAVQSQNIHIAGGKAGDKTKIIWNLDRPTAEYKFDESLGSQGMLIVKDHEGSTNGKADHRSDTQVDLDHKFKKKGGEVTYYPLVIFTPSGLEPVLCGAGDPTIVND